MRKTIFVLVLLVGLLVVGCAAPESPPNKDDTPINGANTVHVARSVSASSVTVGGTITVTLTKTLKADETTLLVEENFPQDWTIVDKGMGTVNGNTIRWAELQGAKSGTYTYTVKAPATAGTGTFFGQYSVMGKVPENIGGSIAVTVQ